MNIKKKIVVYLYSVLRKKMLSYVRRDVGANIRCGNCNTWEHSNILEGYYNTYTAASHNGHEFGYTSKCGRCGEHTTWNCEIAPVMVPCDNTGTPIT